MITITVSSETVCQADATTMLPVFLLMLQPLAKNISKNWYAIELGGLPRAHEKPSPAIGRVANGS